MVAALGGMNTDTLAQGRIIFANNASTLISTNSAVGGFPTGTISGPIGTYYFALFVASPGTTDPALFDFTGAYGTNTSSGRFSGGQPEIAGYAFGSTASFLIRGWSSNIGHEYSDVLNYLANPAFDAWYGESLIATIPIGGDTPPPESPFGFVPGKIPGFTLEMYTIPEPSSAAFAGFGLATLAFLRRRSL